MSFFYIIGNRIQHILKTFIIISIIFVSINRLFSNSENIRFEQVPAPEAEFTGAVIQDNEGFLWFCSYAGVYVFDGIEFKLFKQNDPIIKSMSMRDILLDSRGNIWILSDNSGVVKYSKNSDSYELFTQDKGGNGLSSVALHSCNLMCEDLEGNIWIGTGNGLNCYDYKTEKFTSYLTDERKPFSISGNEITAVYCDEDGYVWIGTKNNGLN